MGIRCATCRHPQVAMIDATLLAGRSQREVAASFDLGHDSVSRHVLHGHVAAAVNARAARLPMSTGTLPTPSSPTASTSDAGAGLPAPASSNSLDSLRAQKAYLEAIDLGAVSVSQSLAVLDARRKTDVDIARLDPPVVPRPPDTPTIARFVDLFEAIIERHPEERELFMAEWRRWKQTGGDA